MNKQQKSDQNLYSVLNSNRQQPGLMLRVIILKGGTKSCDPNIENLKNLFKSKEYKVDIVVDDFNYQPKQNPIKDHVDDLDKIKINKYDYHQNCTFLRLFKFYSQNQQPLLIIKDNSVSNLSNKIITNKIQSAFAKAPEADLYYLCSWNDNPNDYQWIDEKESCGSRLVFNNKSSGIQAVIFSVAAQNYLLEQLNQKRIKEENFENIIKQSKLKAVAFVPNLIDFDGFLALADTDYQKLNKTIDQSTVGSEQTSESGWLVFMIILVFFVIVLFFYLTYYRKNGR